MSWGNLSPTDDKRFDVWFEKYVPESGNCKTLGGEIIRAISRMVYRYYNDGDTINDYYGSDYNCVKGADIFLKKYVPNYVSLADVTENEYESSLCQRLKFIHDYLLNNPQVFETPNEDDYLNYQVYEPQTWDDEEEYEDWDEDFDDEN